MTKFFSLALVSFFSFHSLLAQEIPDVKLATLDGNNFQTQKFNESVGKLVVLSFWATWCIPCINELSVINDNLEGWHEKLAFDLYAISEDDSRTTKRVQPLINGKGWSMPILLDKNQDLKRALNIASIPYTVVVKNGKIIFRHLGYVVGDENQLYKIIQDNQ